MRRQSCIADHEVAVRRHRCFRHHPAGCGALCCALSLPQTPLAGAVYRCTGANGQLAFTNKPGTYAATARRCRTTPIRRAPKSRQPAHGKACANTVPKRPRRQAACRTSPPRPRPGITRLTRRSAGEASVDKPVEVRRGAVYKIVARERRHRIHQHPAQSRWRISCCSPTSAPASPAMCIRPSTGAPRALNLTRLSRGSCRGGDRIRRRSGAAARRDPCRVGVQSECDLRQGRRGPDAADAGHGVGSGREQSVRRQPEHSRRRAIPGRAAQAVQRRRAPGDGGLQRRCRKMCRSTMACRRSTKPASTSIASPPCASAITPPSSARAVSAAPSGALMLLAAVCSCEVTSSVERRLPSRNPDSCTLLPGARLRLAIVQFELVR